MSLLTYHPHNYGAWLALAPTLACSNLLDSAVLLDSTGDLNKCLLLLAPRQGPTSNCPPEFTLLVLAIQKRIASER